MSKGKMTGKDHMLFLGIISEMIDIFMMKNIDYGSSYREDGLVGVVIRLGDKLKRLKTISKRGHQISVKEEKLRDTLMDIANYSAIALMLHDEKNVCKKKATYSNNKQKFIQQSQDRTGKHSKTR